MYARTKTYSVKSIGSRFTETDKILQKIDEDKFISSSGSAISAVRRKDVSIHTFVQWRRMIDCCEINMCHSLDFNKKTFWKILSRLDVSTGTNSEQYIDTLAAFTTVFDEMNEVLNRSKRAREHLSRSMRKSRSQRTFENQFTVLWSLVWHIPTRRVVSWRRVLHQTLQVSTGVMIFTYFVEYRYFLWIRLGAFFALHRQENW
jgi:hypothetical protein